MSASPADRLRSKKPRQITIGIFLDEGPADRLDAAVMARMEARQQQRDGFDLIEDLAVQDAAVDAAQAALDEATMWFTFRGLGRTAFARLQAEHPPTDEQLAEAEVDGQDRPQWNGATFAPALIAASCAAPVLALEDVEAIYDDEAWNVAELGALFGAALGVNIRARPPRVRPSP